MTTHQDALTEATNAYVDADKALSEAMTSAVYISDIKELWDRARTTRLAYAKALDAAGYAVPVGLDYDK